MCLSSLVLVYRSIYVQNSAEFHATCQAGATDCLSLADLLLADHPLKVCAYTICQDNAEKEDSWGHYLKR